MGYGIVLAGGRSERMGQDKALLAVDGAPLIQRVTDVLRSLGLEVLLVTDRIDRYPSLPYETVLDEYSDAGPVGGILARASASQIPTDRVWPRH